jgi:putative effector of murein hydrolase LrgA (UPF0299 family)
MHEEHLYTVNLILRYLIYTGIMLAGLAALPTVLQPDDLELFRENGPIEWLQLGAIVFAALILGAGALVEPEMRGMFGLLSCVASIAAVRELDKILDALLPGGWQGPMAGLVLLFSCLYYRYRKTIWVQAGSFVRTAPFGVLWAGFVITILLAQLAGHGTLLQLIMGDNYDRAYKRVIEEITEMFGYTVILLGSIEAIAFGRVSRKAVASQSADLLYKLFA